MRTICLLLFGSLLILISSCGKDSKKCGDDSKDRSTGFPTIEASTFQLYKTQNIVVQGVTYSANYQNTGTNGAFQFKTIVGSVCQYEPIIVSPVFSMKILDTTANSHLVIASQDGTQLDELLTRSGLQFSKDEVYTFNEESASTTYTIVNTIYFKTKGGWAADSVYFFNNLLDSYGFHSSYKTTQ